MQKNLDLKSSKGSYKDHLYALILAGGGGTRLWPRSRNKTPKQFLKLFDKKTLVEVTGERMSKLMPWSNIFVVTSTKPYGDKIKELLPHIPSKNIIIEPMRRDTAAAHAIGALYILNRDPDAVILNAASDHFVTPQYNFERTMKAAAKFCFESGGLLAVGIRPTYPHTGLGHIKQGKKVAESLGRYVFKLDKFVEKPPIDLAKKYTASGKYFWNANHYVWKGNSFLSEVKKYAPKLYEGMEKIKGSLGSKNITLVTEREYKKLDKISVDYAVSEKSKEFYMMIADYNWTDIGDWNEVWKNLSKDSSGNVIIDGDEPGGEIINIDTSDALIHKDGRTIAIIDVDNIVIVDTKDALLVCSKSKSQNVKKVVNILKEKKQENLL